ncbi:50S ribosomal protein L29, partial [Mycoplasmopsis synoviae]|uniref:50S ribosomal protein L29 n=1 Tax=Mycoplasmopsis synoviae TaxID=2109 RepID=UPI00387B53DE
MQFKEVKAKSVEELHKLVNDLKAELWILEFRNSTGSLEQTHKIPQLRKDIARALTALKQKEMETK